MKVRELLDQPEKWTRNVLARDIMGQTCDLHSAYATCWCLAGAVGRCYPEPDRHDSVLKQIRLAIYGRGSGLIGTWNDAPGRTFEEVKELVERLDI